MYLIVVTDNFCNDVMKFGDFFFQMTDYFVIFGRKTESKFCLKKEQKFNLKK